MLIVSLACRGAGVGGSLWSRRAAGEAAHPVRTATLTHMFWSCCWGCKDGSVKALCTTWTKQPTSTASQEPQSPNPYRRIAKTCANVRQLYTSATLCPIVAGLHAPSNTTRGNPYSGHAGDFQISVGLRTSRFSVTGAVLISDPQSTVSRLPA